MRISDWSSDVCSSDLYAGYGLRAQDGGARLDLLRGIVSLHGVDGDASTREARLRRFWTDTCSRNRELRFVDDGRAVEVRQFDASRGDWWKLPLPGARQPLPQSQACSRSGGRVGRVLAP